MPDPSVISRVLVIDDVDANRYILRRILSHAGFEVDVATTGTEGLAKAEMLPDVIIADVNLPDMLGYDLTRRLKSNPLTMSIPVLQMSASFVSDESRAQALEGGADSYLTQPFEPTVLIAHVNALLRMRKAEALSHVAAKQWRSTFDGLSDGIALADEFGVIVRANATFLRIADLVVSEVEGNLLDEVCLAKFGKRLEHLALNSEGSPVEVFDGSRWFRLRLDQISSESQGASGTVLIVSDITDHRKLEETLRLSERLAATGRLAHIIAHEINNPLEAMANLLFLALTSADLQVDTQSYLQQASEQLDRISQITKQVLAYHRESAQPVSVIPDDVLDSVLVIFRTHIMASGIALQTAKGCRCPIVVRPGEIRQVLSNILSNALDAMRSTKGTLRVRCFHCVDYKSGGIGVRFLFSDSGIGIPADVLPKIFDAFYTTKDIKGSGIGLWLSAGSIAKHGGRIRVRTRTDGPYRGTLLDVFIPAA